MKLKLLGKRVRERKRFTMPDVKEARLRGGEIADWTYGNVLTRVYRNRTKKGAVYYTVIQDRIFEKDRRGLIGTSKSFYYGDIQDMVHGLNRAYRWLNEKKREDRQRSP